MSTPVLGDASSWILLYMTASGSTEAPLFRPTESVPNNKKYGLKKSKVSRKHDKESKPCIVPLYYTDYSKKVGHRMPSYNIKLFG